MSFEERAFPYMLDWIFNVGGMELSLGCFDRLLGVMRHPVEECEVDRHV